MNDSAATDVRPQADDGRQADAGEPGAAADLSTAARMLEELKAVDLAIYRAVEGTPTPTLDALLRGVSRFANHSKLWFTIAGLLFAAGGRSGRRAALTGAAAVGLNSFVVNVPLKQLSRRRRPARGPGDSSPDRHVRMPTSSSFPSGHSASGFAFAQAVAATRPELGFPLRALAATVAYSRVHTGVHYPGDVIAGSLVGMAVGEGTARASRALQRSLDSRSA